MRPFWMYYGGKWRLAPRYPAPRYDRIVEPFAGAAGYSVRHNAPIVKLYDTDPIIVGVWRWLIKATIHEVMSLPDIGEGQTVDDYQMCPEARWFVGFWMNKGVAQPRQRPSAWLRAGVRPRSNWGAEVRARIALQLAQIRHWHVNLRHYAELPTYAATWFVDPPYQGKAGSHYTQGSGAIDYGHLAEWCSSLRGQVIVCERAGAQWLPFEPLCNAKTSRGHAREVAWTSAPPLTSPTESG